MRRARRVFQHLTGSLLVFAYRFAFFIGDQDIRVSRSLGVMNHRLGPVGVIRLQLGNNNRCLRRRVQMACGVQPLHAGLSPMMCCNMTLLCFALHLAASSPCCGISCCLSALSPAFSLAQRHRHVVTILYGLSGIKAIEKVLHKEKFTPIG